MKRTTLTEVGGAEKHSHQNPMPQHSGRMVGRDLIRWALLPEEQRDWCPTSGIPIPRIYTKEMSPKPSGLENQWGWCSRVPKYCRKLRLPSKGRECGFTCSETQQNNSTLKSFKTICKGETFANLKSSAGGTGVTGDAPPRCRHWQTP